MQGKMVVSNDDGLMGAMVQTCYKIQTKKSLEASDGMTVNKEPLMMLLFTLFEYNAKFMVNRVNQDLMLQLFHFIQKFSYRELKKDTTLPCMIQT